MRHVTYKHLEAQLRLGSFSLGQWVQISAAGGLAAVFGVYVSPFPASVTMFASIVGAGLPIALSYGAMGLEFSVGQLAVAGWRYWREPRSYLPGPGEQAVGYRVQPEVAHTHPAIRPDGRDLPATGGEPLWDL